MLGRKSVYLDYKLVILTSGNTDLAPQEENTFVTHAKAKSSATRMLIRQHEYDQIGNLDGLVPNCSQ
jgi:hypothetical protein